MSRAVIISKTAEKKLDKLFKYLLKNWSLKVKNDFISKSITDLIQKTYLL